MSQKNTNSRPVVVGSKPTANYALAVQARLAAGDLTIVLRARGKHISQAVDAANMAVNLGLPVTRGPIRWGQETGPQGQNVSFVEVELKAKAAEELPERKGSRSC